MTGGLLHWAWSYVRPYRRGLAALGALSVAEVTLRILAPFALVVVIDHALGGAPVRGTLAGTLDALGLPSGRRALLVEFAVAGMLLQLAHQAVVMVHGRIGVRVGQGMIADLREELFAHVQAWALKHHGTMPAADAVQRLESDTRALDQIVMRGVFPLVFSVLTLIAMFGVLLAIDARLAFVSLAVLPPLYLWLRFYVRRMGPSADRARDTDTQVSSRLYESISSIRQIKIDVREEHEEARFSDVARDNALAWIGVGHQGTVFSIITGGLTILGSSVVLLVGGIDVIDGRISIGTLLLVIAYLGYVYGPLSAIAQTTGDLQRALASARRVRSAFAIVPEPADDPGALAADTIRGEVAFDDVTFAYDGPLVLDRLSFAARPGELVAIVGPSGAGKSTLASMIVRFYDARSGKISIDGVAIDHYRLRSLRRRIGLVLQEAVLASGTIRDNLRFGRLDATDADIERAARAANAHDFIKHLPHGYDTELGERGARLSGGQRQRLSIARAFLKDAPILVLDEPTSALDTIAEIQVIEALHRLCAGRTTFVIAHRMSTVRHADRIIVMEHGRLVAEGTHDMLLETSPLYRELATQFVDPRLPRPPSR